MLTHERDRLNLTTKELGYLALFFLEDHDAEEYDGDLDGFDSWLEEVTREGVDAMVAEIGGRL